MNKIPASVEKWIHSLPEFAEKRGDEYRFLRGRQEYILIYQGASDQNFPIAWHSPAYEQEEEAAIWFKIIFLTATEKYYDCQRLKKLLNANRERTLKNFYYCYSFAFGDGHLINKMTLLHNRNHFIVENSYTAFIVNLQAALKKAGYKVTVTQENKKSIFEVEKCIHS